MVDLYLVTGFLGAGKTTFLKNFIRMLAPLKIRLIINEFGKVGVDAVLLAELGAEMAEINNGSIFCSCRLDKFEETLTDTLRDPPDVIVVEASGLSDPTAIRKILNAERFFNAERFPNVERFASIRYRGAVCVVDAVNFEKVFKTARVCSKQLSVSDLILINKTDVAEPERVQKTIEMIGERYPGVVIHTTVYGGIEKQWLDALGRDHVNENEVHDRDLTLQKLTLTIAEGMSLLRFEHFLHMFIEETYRIKGFVKLDGRYYLVDCVGSMVNVKSWEGDVPHDINTIVVLAGKGMNPRRHINQAMEWYPGLITH